jgi:hypothetical protein
VCGLEKEEEGQRGQCECGKSDGKEWEWAKEEGRCECGFGFLARKTFTRPLVEVRGHVRPDKSG